ncbi:NFACT family protein [Microcoleus sp. FACHB-SPT15]|uniref:Rqc2 family fibronectin-binding protein n=1 Tax=Microcoleus sp. FACHB-SPT15 TaxID=2692830 RepID=UPI00177F98E7|nr:NFACT family protein [Microcoleus sp. FACHB-SPT15]MBD1807205.1 NFACT family protein [Microcoleus sp. FACHB-SPT15]
MQPVDFTTLMAACCELRSEWVPGRTEQVYQRDRFTIAIGLRTLKSRGWLTICWHPQAARIGLSDPPPRTPDTFTFSDQLRHQLTGLALIGIEAIAPWERVLDLQFARRPGEAASFHLYVEIISKYSNVILTGADNLIITVAHQVSSQQSSIRPIQTGQPYERPPALTGTSPNLSESQERWQERVSLVPGALQRQLLKSYRGLSPALVRSMAQAADLNPDQSTESLDTSDWQRLFQRWQEWLQVMGNGEDIGGSQSATVDTSSHSSQFQPGWTTQGYTVLGWGMIEPVSNVQSLLDSYYTAELNQQEFAQLRHQLTQKLGNILGKLRQKASTFEERLQQSDQADQQRQQADLLMAHLHEWEPGMKSITLADFDTGKPVTIPLNPEKNAVQNAQALYKRHQKLKRARKAVEPLLKDVQEEIQYLEQVEASLNQLDTYATPEDLQTLQEIREELIGQRYLDAPEQRSREVSNVSEPHRYRTPSGFELLIGRNNRQNDQLTFRTAGDYDLWFHTQEIAGSHVLMRLQAGTVPDEADLQFAADLAAHYSQARQSDQVPVVYTEPKHVYKPKGAKPGMAIYKRERILWGRPQKGNNYLLEDDTL